MTERPPAEDELLVEPHRVEVLEPLVEAGWRDAGLEVLFLLGVDGHHGDGGIGRDDSQRPGALRECGDGTAEQLARQIIERRLRVAMPRTAEETRLRYVSDHLATSQLFRSSSHVLLFGCADAIAAIPEAEKIFISCAIAAGAPLINEQHRNHRGAVLEEGLRLALEVIEAGVSLGLAAQAGDAWRSAILNLYHTVR